MKTAILLFLTMSCFSQVSYSAYVPLRTYHFDRRDANLWWMDKTEGGNIGLIITRREGLSEIQFGAINNSYGDLSIVAMGGISAKAGIFRLGVSGGLATGYKSYYRYLAQGQLQKRDDILSRNGIMPQLAANISLDKGAFSPLLVISPFFINAGIKYNFN